MVQRYYAAIKGLLEGLQKVKAFTTSLLCHHDTLTATVDREVLKQPQRWCEDLDRVASSLSTSEDSFKQKLNLRPRQHLLFGGGTPLLPHLTISYSLIDDHHLIDCACVYKRESERKSGRKREGQRQVGHGKSAILFSLHRSELAFFGFNIS